MDIAVIVTFELGLGEKYSCVKEFLLFACPQFNHIDFKGNATILEYLPCMCLGECGLGKVDFREKTGALSGTKFELELREAATANNMNTGFRRNSPIKSYQV